MKSSEMAAKAIAEGVVIIHDQYGIQTVLKVVIEQVLNGLDNNNADLSIVKNISTFFSELGTSAPQLVMPYIREIASDVLNLDSYQLRICILQLMSDIVISELKEENLPQAEREVRDEYLDHIYSHIHDCNAHVRSKVISIWTKMAEMNAFPVTWTSQVLRRVVGRLEDKSNLVRKSSIVMIKVFLEHNPFAAKLSLEEIEEKYEAKMKELSDLRSKMLEEAEKTDKVNENWEQLVMEMKPYIVDVLKMDSIEDEQIRPEDCANLYEIFPKLIEEKDFERLMLLVRKSEELNGNWRTIVEMEDLHAQVYFVVLLKTHFCMQNSCKDYEADYKKTEKGVQFLEDSLEFSKLIVSAVPKLQDLLMSKVDSDVTEAIDFFTSAFMFGVKNTESGMRQLLYLVWSLSKDKRGPVQEAYKKVLFTTDHTGR
jgi:condensin complex subunit 1